ncbi:ATP-binding cassette domain-containing protein [Lactobacillus sp. S2-2]|uniref:methionine ABC transporter ATP-binding protein n=1 Tax=Lactobacillus sp. S2-2 TaxID=2692917 RepID=UPI001F1B87BA|nr:methionine ABC transporter ATP-binding protein [Lactobacillus sp. S2-2]MCF6514675.1 ATP-binding cassette domain-containing protein [Lactobacillus sp. S2-2]
MTENIIELDKVNVKFPLKDKTIHAVKDVSLSIKKGDIFGVVGYSGAGKSTLVRTINLLQKPSSGIVKVLGKEFYKNVDGKEKNISVGDLRKERRNIGMIFQHFNLLNERTVQDNIAFALKHSKLKEKEIINKSIELLDLVGLKEFAKSYPAQLSGGQQQRVAIARALANDPEILISDEATSALDPENTNQILDLLKKINQKLGLTVVLITHEMDAIKRICNNVAIMDSGELIEKGNIMDIFVHSTNPVTRKFIGNSFDAISILNSLNLSKKPDAIVQLTYTSDDIGSPIIVELYKQFGVKANIIYSNIEVLQDKPIGTNLIGIDGNQDSIKKALNYLHESNIKVTEIKEEQ